MKTLIARPVAAASAAGADLICLAEIFAQVGYSKDAVPLTAQTVDGPVFHVNYHEEKLDRLLAERTGVRAEPFAEEGIFTLESDDPAWPAPRLIAHFGLEAFDQYHRRAAALQDQVRSRTSAPMAVDRSHPLKL